MMVAAEPPEPALRSSLPNRHATRRLALDVATMLVPGDVVTLSGDLGAGKTTFARSLIQHLAGDERIEVPSPTFTLMQVYELPRASITHADLFRLNSPAELAEVDLREGDARRIVLVEWPDRAGAMLPPDRLDIELRLVPRLGQNYREVVVTGRGEWQARAERLARIRQFFGSSEFAEAERRHVQGDASSRAYERLQQGGRRAIFMNAPRRPDGPPVRGGRPYSAIAHLAEDVTPFVAMARGLRERGFSAPEIFAADLNEGLLILEDLGTETVVRGTPPRPMPERYEAAVDVLVELHAQTLPNRISVAPRVEHVLPEYDENALLIEVDLLPEWYLPHRGASLARGADAQFAALWREALWMPRQEPKTWVLRDYHSPNLLWLNDREGIGRVGLLDFQDAVMGPGAYDVASLLQDARVDVPDELARDLLAHYVKGRRARDPAFDPAHFLRVYATLGAQRATKILGIFARLDRRDGKPQYLAHQPRVWRYLQQCLSHVALTSLRIWYEEHVPPPT